MQAIVRIDEPATGLHNMAVDETLLQEAEHFESLVLRVYRWSRPTLSLGHFQREHDIPSDVAWGQIDRVTRKTGGGAIVHDLELTYSLVIPHRHNARSIAAKARDQGGGAPALGTKGPSELIYRAIHNGLLEGLRELDLNANLAEECTCKLAGESATQSFLCFERRSPVDIVINGVKVVGSAQRRSQFGLLQHGSVLLRKSSSAETLFGILDFLEGRRATVSPPERGCAASDRESSAPPVGARADSIDWGKWTDWLVGNLKSSIENAFEGYWRFG